MNTINSPTATNLARGTIIELAQNVYNNAFAAKEQADRAKKIVDGVAEIGEEADRAKAEADRAKAEADRAQSLVNGIPLSAYPVGSVYISVDSRSPALLFGGSWTRIQDRFLLAAGSSYSAGAIGGSADAVVVEHEHTFASVYGTNAGSNTSAVTWGADGGKESQNATDKTGESGIGKNMPPYIVVYMWERTA